MPLDVRRRFQFAFYALLISPQAPAPSTHVLACRIMARIRIRTDAVWYSQFSCGSTFTCGKLLLDTIHELQDGRTNHLHEPKFVLDVVYVHHSRRWISLDNRRLYVLRRARCIFFRRRVVGRCAYWGRHCQVWHVTSRRKWCKISSRDAYWLELAEL